MSPSVIGPQSLARPRREDGFARGGPLNLCVQALMKQYQELNWNRKMIKMQGRRMHVNFFSWDSDAIRTSCYLARRAGAWERYFKMLLFCWEGWQGPLAGKARMGELATRAVVTSLLPAVLIDTSCIDGGMQESTATSSHVFCSQLQPSRGLLRTLLDAGVALHSCHFIFLCVRCLLVGI